MIFWLILAAATAWLLWYMVKVPGASYRGALKPLAGEEQLVAANLRRHIAAIASREHNFLKPAELEASALYIEKTLASLGYVVAAQRYSVQGKEVRNIEVEFKGDTRASEIVLVGAHYDSVAGAPGANDNGSGVAAVLELARLLKDAKPARTLRCVLFVNEEPPFDRTDAMGSRVYARRPRERGENVVAMFSLETIGYYPSMRQPALSVSARLFLSVDRQLHRLRFEPVVARAAA